MLVFSLKKHVPTSFNQVLSWDLVKNSYAVYERFAEPVEAEKSWESKDRPPPMPPQEVRPY